jgi:hypothetical protein
MLHHFIDSIEDKKAAAIYTLFEDEISAGDQRKNLIRSERANYLNGSGKSYGWDQVKEMAINKCT